MVQFIALKKAFDISVEKVYFPEWFQGYLLQVFVVT
jgi:hypothetical protein